MGKAQTKKKTQAWRHNPIRVPDSHLGGGRAEGKADAAKEKQMLPILNKLKSPQYADRTWACAAICNLVQNDPATRRLFQGRNVVGELIERLSDDVDEVVVEASGALRNLAIDGGHELCGEMYNKGVMAHLNVLMGKISTTVDSILASDPTTAPELTDAQLQSRKHLLSLSENIISLIWCLAETSHKTLDAVNAAGVEGLLVKVLEGRDITGSGVALASSQALYSLSQDNPPFRNALLRHPTALVSLGQICRQDHRTAGESSKKAKGKSKKTNGDSLGDELEADDGRALLIRLLLCGVLRNVVQLDSPADDALDLRALTSDVVLPLVNDLLDVNLEQVVAKVSGLVAQVPQQQILATGAEKGMKTDYRSPAEISLDRIERLLYTVSIALEILTGVCAGLEDPEEAEDQSGLKADHVNEGEDEDEAMDASDVDGEVDDDEQLIDSARDPVLDEMEAVMYGTGNGHGTETGDDDEDAEEPWGVSNAATLPHLINTLRLPERLARLAHPTGLSFPPSSASQPSPHPPTTAALSVVHLRALEALNNLMLTVAAAAADSPAVLKALPALQAGTDGQVQATWEGVFAIVLPLVAEQDVLPQRGQEMRGEVLAAACGAAWGVGKVALADLKVSPNQIEALVASASLVKADSARSRIIDLLANLAARPKVSLEENQAISGFIVSQLSAAADTPGAPVEVLVALLNAVIDIYADETREYDQVFRQQGYLAVLAGMVAKVRSKARSVDKRKDRRMRAQAEEAYENLAAFVKYRRSLA